MKNFLLFFVLFSSGLVASAHELPSNAVLPIEFSANSTPFQLIIAIEEEGMMQQVTLHFNSETDLQDFNSFDFADTLFNRDLTSSLCTVSITVTVRVGVGSNFVEASGSASGIPCSQVSGAIKRLRQELYDAIK